MVHIAKKAVEAFEEFTNDRFSDCGIITYMRKPLRGWLLLRFRFALWRMKTFRLLRTAIMMLNVKEISRDSIEVRQRAHPAGSLCQDLKVSKKKQWKLDNKEPEFAWDGGDRKCFMMDCETCTKNDCKFKSLTEES